ncbi:unnamed protein product [Caretta caretta]
MIPRDSLPKGCPVPKSLSGTWWSANAEAVNAVVLGYPNILGALESIKDDESQKSATRKDVKILSDAMCTLETGILCEVWNDILQPINRKEDNDCYAGRNLPSKAIITWEKRKNSQAGQESVTLAWSPSELNWIFLYMKQQLHGSQSSCKESIQNDRV